MQFLSFDTVVDLHTMLTDQFGGLHGLRDENLLESAIIYPQMLHTLGLEQNVSILAAAYCYHLIQNHPFIEGNKRIGTLAMMTFLRINGHIVSIPKTKLYELAISVATSQLREHDIAHELEKYILAH